MGTANVSDHALEQLSKGMLGFGHPVRARCLILLADEHSPSELYELQSELDEEGNVIPDSGPSLGTVSYHVRMLRDYGLVREVRVQPRRGALEHFYRRTALADEILNAVAPLYGLPRRGATRAQMAEAA